MQLLMSSRMLAIIGEFAVTPTTLSAPPSSSSSSSSLFSAAEEDHGGGNRHVPRLLHTWSLLLWLRSQHQRLPHQVTHMHTRVHMHTCTHTHTVTVHSYTHTHTHARTHACIHCSTTDLGHISSGGEVNRGGLISEIPLALPGTTPSACSSSRGWSWRTTSEPPWLLLCASITRSTELFPRGSSSTGMASETGRCGGRGLLQGRNCFIYVTREDYVFREVIFRPCS